MQGIVDIIIESIKARVSVSSPRNQIPNILLLLTFLASTLTTLSILLPSSPHPAALPVDLFLYILQYSALYYKHIYMLTITQKKANQNRKHKCKCGVEKGFSAKATGCNNIYGGTMAKLMMMFHYFLLFSIIARWIFSLSLRTLSTLISSWQLSFLQDYLGDYHLCQYYLSIM